MFKKNHEVSIESGFAMDLVKVLGRHGVKFEVSDEYVNDIVRDHPVWYRRFTILATDKTYKKLMAEFRANTNIGR